SGCWVIIKANINCPVMNYDNQQLKDKGFHFKYSCSLAVLIILLGLADGVSMPEEYSLGPFAIALKILLSKHALKSPEKPVPPILNIPKSVHKNQLIVNIMVKSISRLLGRKREIKSRNEKMI
ncbi:hypothetical protein HPG69_016225, partial [Diceros bicornis minor]